MSAAPNRSDRMSEGENHWRMNVRCSSAFLLSPFHCWSGKDMVSTLLNPVVAGSPSTREEEMCLTGRRVTAHVCVKSEDMKSRLGPNTSEVRNFQPAFPLVRVIVSSPIKRAQPA